MLTLLEVKTDNTYSGLVHFEPINKSTSIKALFSEKHTSKLLKSRANNDRILKRVSLMAINYHDGDKFALFSLLPIGAEWELFSIKTGITK